MMMMMMMDHHRPSKRLLLLLVLTALVSFSLTTTTSVLVHAASPLRDMLVLAPRFAEAQDIPWGKVHGEYCGAGYPGSAKASKAKGVKPKDCADTCCMEHDLKYEGFSPDDKKNYYFDCGANRDFVACLNKCKSTATVWMMKTFFANIPCQCNQWVKGGTKLEAHKPLFNQRHCLPHKDGKEDVEDDNARFPSLQWCCAQTKLSTLSAWTLKKFENEQVHVSQTHAADHQAKQAVKQAVKGKGASAPAAVRAGKEVLKPELFAATCKDACARLAKEAAKHAK